MGQQVTFHFKKIGRQLRLPYFGWRFSIGRSTISYVGTWVLSDHDSSAAPQRSRHPYAVPRTSLQCVCTRRRNCIEQLSPSTEYAPRTFYFQPGTAQIYNADHTQRGFCGKLVVLRCNKLAQAASVGGLHPRDLVLHLITARPPTRTVARARTRIGKEGEGRW